MGPLMIVERISDIEQLQPLAEGWNLLTRGVPFRSWQWLSRWWQHYRGKHELYVLAVFQDGGQLAGLGPWYLDCSTTCGRVIKSLGSGEVCSDYLTFLTTPETVVPAATAAGQWLAQAAANRTADRWDLLHLEAVAADDPAVAQLVAAIVEQGGQVHQREMANCWRIELPDDWEDYLARMSKSHRKQIRRVERRLLETDRVAVHTATTVEELQHAWPILVDLHQRRRASLDQPGCFANEVFAGFLRQAAEDLSQHQRTQLVWADVDGQPLAAELHFLGDQTTYAYQAGVDPDRLDLEPGRLINIAALQRAIDRGQRHFDFLRGDEPYKAHWRAIAQPLVELRVASNQSLARLRHSAWVAGDTMKSWLKSVGSPFSAGSHN